jgi:uncharacterized membrane protein HdeD (DUF308 family)
METQMHMREHLERSWGWIVLRGVLAVLFGLFAIARPDLTLTALVIMWGVWAITDGVFAVVAGWRIRDGGRPLWSLFVVGGLGIVAGVLTFKWPGLTAMALLMVIAIWAVGVGIFQFVTAIRLRKVLEGEWALALSGLLSVAFGVLMMVHPSAGALAVVWMIAANAISLGVLLCVLGFRVRSATHRKLVPA